ncbi:MAG: hypothetical protein VX899_02925 [Myxococcota bacterium]|nr:hypothetical protein [Myxococcota bacterium]
MILVTGFSQFPGVPENPTEHLALALNGTEVEGQDLVGVVLPVTYEGLSSRLTQLETRWRPELVVGLGVAVGSERPRIEILGVNEVAQTQDASGRIAPDLGPGPRELRVGLPVEGIRQELGAELSRDAGRYLCNAWLYTALRDLQAPALFVHVPMDAPSPQRMGRAIARLWRELRARD